MIFILTFSATLFMTGLIWLVQLVHYPYFRFTDHEHFVEAQRFHQSRISWIVLPVMLVELIGSIALLIWQADEFPQWFLWSQLVLLIVIWGSTFLIQVPHHSRLSEKFDERTIQRLVCTNWCRTYAWSLRSLFFMGIALKLGFDS